MRNRRPMLLLAVGLLALRAYPQSQKPQITVPGVAGRIDTKSLVDAVMEPERAKLKSREEELGRIRKEKSVWQDLRQRLDQLEAAARGLYGPQNPFREKSVQSGDNRVFVATATREAAAGGHKVRVLQLAQADRFVSDPVDPELTAAAGTYTFRVGTEEARVTFAGGSLRELVDAINRQAGRLVQAKILRASERSQVLLIESKKSGSENKLSLAGAAADLAVRIGLLAAPARQLAVPPMTPESVTAAGERDRIVLRDGTLTLRPGGEAILPFPGGVEIGEAIVLEVRLRVSSLEAEAWKAPSPPPGPAVTSPGRAEFQGNVVESEPSGVLMPPWTPPEPPRRVDDLNLIAAAAGGRETALPPIDARDGEQVWRTPLGKTVPRLEALVFRNRNTHREIVVQEVRLVDPSARGDYRPQHVVSEASDAVLELDGVRVTRSRNEIDDLLPGVTITLLGESDKPLDLEVKANLEMIKNAIIKFVGLYNQLLGRIDVLTRTDEQVVADLEYLGEDERKTAQEQLGMLQGDLALNQLRDRLRQTVSAPYPTSAGRDLTLLVQLGIGTDAARTGGEGGVRKSRLRGYLEIDEAKLESVLSAKIDAVRELFGNDTDGDYVVDAGVAFAVAQGVRPYTQVGGLIANRVANIDQTAGRRERELERMRQELSDKEARLKQQYTEMEGALDTLERSSRRLDDFSSGLSGTRNR